MKKLTNKQRVANRLKRYGVVSNYWAWQNGVWRLSHIIFELRREGWDISLEYNTPRVGRNSNYHLVSFNNGKK